MNVNNMGVDRQMVNQVIPTILNEHHREELPAIFAGLVMNKDVALIAVDSHLVSMRKNTVVIKFVLC